MSEANFKTENINTWITELNTEAKAAISVDCVIFGYEDNQLKVLLIECNMPPFEGKLSLLGDLVKSNENLDEAAARILKARTGLNNVYLEQVRAFGDPGRHPLGRVISMSYVSLIKIQDYEVLDIDQKRLKWFPVDQVEEMAFDHAKILNVTLNWLQDRIKERPIGFELLPKKFTLIQLQNLYEIILNVKLDKRNFRRKLSSLGVLKDIGESQKDVAHRPAKLYSFAENRSEQKNGLSSLINF